MAQGDFTCKHHTTRALLEKSIKKEYSNIETASYVPGMGQVLNSGKSSE
jgi:hypothetical protein